MPVNRQIFKSWITKNQAPAVWSCPRCSGGHLRLVPKSLFEELDADTKQASTHDWYDHERVRTRFVAALRCDNNACKEIAVVAGRGFVEAELNDDHTDVDYVDYYIPQYFWPAPHLISIPIRTPEPIQKLLELAFSAVWNDPVAASVHIRNAVDALLTYLKVPRTKLSKKKRIRLSLHERISKLGARSKQTHDYLMAIKWLGNAGVHALPFTLMTHVMLWTSLRNC